MRKLVRSCMSILSLFFLQCTPQVFAQSNQQQKPAPTGDIDMNQFKNLEQVDRRKADRQILVKLTCTDDQGRIIKKGEPGFDTCITQSQSRLLKQPTIPEAPDDGRKR